MNELTQLFKEFLTKARVSNSNELLEAIKDTIHETDQLEQIRFDEIPAYRNLTPSEKAKYWNIVKQELINRIDALIEYKKIGLDWIDVVEIEHARYTLTHEDEIEV